MFTDLFFVGIFVSLGMQETRKHGDMISHDTVREGSIVYEFLPPMTWINHQMVISPCL